MSSLKNQYFSWFPFKRTSREIKDENTAKTILRPPSDLLLHEPIQLTVFDMLVPPIYILHLHFFRNPSTIATFMPTNKLIASFHQTLNQFPVLYGKLDHTNDGPTQIIPTDRGITITVEQATVEFDDMEPDWSISKIPKTFLATDSLPQAGDAPLIAARITRLPNNEGVAISVAIHHCITDDHGLLLFLNTWAAYTRGEPIQSSHYSNIDLLRLQGPNILNDGVYRLLKKKYTDEHKDLILSSTKSASIKTGLFRISSEQLLCLKRDAVDTHAASNFIQTTAESWVSPNDALIALIWRAIIRAKQHSANKQSNLYLFIDSRPRWNPPLPKEFFGNAIYCLELSLLTGNLLQKPIGEIARQIHEESAKLNGDYLQSTLTSKPTLISQAKEVQHALITDTEVDVGITNLSSFPIYSVNFGYGTPVCCRVFSNLHKNRVVIIPAPNSFEGIEVLIALNTDHIDRLSKDESLAIMPSILIKIFNSIVCCKSQ
ncbi:transferase [Syncephalis fuscata]|nr:transferase [Syncephalis fuscata]